MFSRVSRWRRGADRRAGKEILVSSLNVSNEVERRETGPSGFSWESMANPRGPRGFTRELLSKASACASAVTISHCESCEISARLPSAR